MEISQTFPTVGMETLNVILVHQCPPSLTCQLEFLKPLEAFSFWDVMHMILTHFAMLVPTLIITQQRQQVGRAFFINYFGFSSVVQ